MTTPPKNHCARCGSKFTKANPKSCVGVHWAGECRDLCDKCGDFQFDWQYINEGKGEHPMKSSVYFKP